MASFVNENEISDFSRADNSANKIHWIRKVVYGFGIIPSTMVLLPLTFYFNFFALETVKLDPDLAGIVINMALITDAITDPICGLLVNRTRTRFGQFKPWMFVSVPLIVLSFWFCFFYPDILTTSISQLVYYMIMMFATHTFVTTYFIPYMAMIMSLSSDPKERQDFVFAQTFCQAVSSILAVLVFGKITDVKRIEIIKENYVNVTGWPDAAAIRDEKLHYSYATIVSGVIILITAYLCIFGSKETNRQLDAQSQSSHSNKLAAVKEFFNNLKSVVFFPEYMKFVALVVTNAFVGVNTVMGFSFYGFYTMKHPTHVSNLISLYMSMPIAAILPMQLSIKYLGLKFLTIIGFMIYIPSGLMFFFLPETAHVGWLYLLACMNGIVFGILNFALFSIIPYLIDNYSSKQRKTDNPDTTISPENRNETLFYSFFVFFIKVGSSIPPVVINSIMKAFGYNQTPNAEQPDSVATSLRYILMVSQISLAIFSITVLLFIRINDNYKYTSINLNIQELICRKRIRKNDEDV